MSLLSVEDAIAIFRRIPHAWRAAVLPMAAIGAVGMSELVTRQGVADVGERVAAVDDRCAKIEDGSRRRDERMDTLIHQQARYDAKLESLIESNARIENILMRRHDP